MNRNAIVILVVLAIVSTGHLVNAQRANPADKQAGATAAEHQLIITGAEPDLNDHTLLISGRNFGGGRATRNAKAKK